MDSTANYDEDKLVRNDNSRGSTLSKWLRIIIIFFRGAFLIGFPFGIFIYATFSNLPDYVIIVSCFVLGITSVIFAHLVNPQIAVIVFLLVDIVLWSWIGYQWRQRVLFGKQLQNLSLFRSYRQSLDKYKKTNGEYPKTLEVLLPLWGGDNEIFGYDVCNNEVLYETKDNQFILMSFGKDGIFDGIDPWALRNSEKELVSICYTWDADHIISDRGEHRICGK